MAEGPIGTALQFAHDAGDLPALLRHTAASIEQLGPDVRILDVVVRPDALTTEVYFLRTD